MPRVVGVLTVILLVGVGLRRLRQPHVVAYLAAGVVLGPSGLAVVEDSHDVARLGEMGVVLLLFFAGMEMSLPELLAAWRVPVLGTVLQVGVSVALAGAVGAWSGWTWTRSLLVGFVISLSSTGVVMKILRDRKETETPVGRDVVGVLLVQDLAVIPMLVCIGLLGKGDVDPRLLATQVVGGIAVIAILFGVARRPSVRLPFGELLREDHELQVFSAFLLAFGTALITGAMGLSAPLGAFLAGVVVGAARETEWVSRHLHPFHVLFLALFFVSVGMLLDLRFIADNVAIIVSLVFGALLLNTAINGAALRMLGRSWPKALYGAALLAQIGEFSFVLAAVGREAELLTAYGHQLTIAVIALSLLLSPLWIAAGRRLLPAGDARAARNA